MLFDTDIFIWGQRGDAGAIDLLGSSTDRCLSVQTLMELLQGAKNKAQHDTIKAFLKEFDFMVLPLTENIGHRALVYVEQYAMGFGITAADALIAATAAENNQVLATGNVKHFKPLKDLRLRQFVPSK